MKRNIITISIIIIFVAFAIYTQLGKQTENPQEGYLAPAFELQGLDGKTYNLKQLDKPVLINFWATWCGPCRIEMPMLTNLYQKYGDQIEFYAINLTNTDKIDNVQAFVNEYNMTFPILLDKAGEITDLYQILGIPATLFIDREKVIYKIASGLHREDELETWIREVIQK